MAPRLSNALNKRMERICLAINAYSHPSTHNFHEVAFEMQISYRQLQRDFASFFGMTPVEYERTIRFYRAAENLKTMSLSKAALISGYYDQAHMAKEFRVLSGRTPLEIRRLETLELPQIHNCDRPISSCISI
jgi:transcriptional regulator GlxA family with amidase domain